MKRNKVIAIGLDAADPNLIDKWMEAGHLNTIKALREQGTYGRLTNVDYHRAEVPWTSFLSGCLPEKTGYWTPVKFRPESYDPSETQAYDFQEYPPFYALGEDYKVAIFDMPQTTLSDRVNGYQILAWGAHSPQTPSHSMPAELFSEIEAKHGKHPALNKDFADCRDIEALKKLERQLEIGLSRRASICSDLMQREDWDLFLTIFGETHSAGHSFWHLSQPHPLYKLGHEEYSDSLLETFKASDRTISEILKSVPEDAYVIVFSVHGMESNILDLTSRLFLPEFLYRWSFNGHKAISTPGKTNQPVRPPIKRFKKRGWMGEIWSMKHDSNPLMSFLRKNSPTGFFQKLEKKFGATRQPDLESPYDQMYRSDGLFYMPANWYKPFWPTMKAFALPSHSEGCIRINLRGRESHGIVDPQDYQKVCDEICAILENLVDARTKKPMVKEIIRTRETGFEMDSKLPDSDLLVMWSDTVTDTIDSPDLGRFGPVPYHRTGSHRSEGFAVITGPGIAANSSFPICHAVNLPATILEFLGAPIPGYFDGTPIIRKVVEAAQT